MHRVSLTVVLLLLVSSRVMAQNLHDELGQLVHLRRRPGSALPGRHRRPQQPRVGPDPRQPLRPGRRGQQRHRHLVPDELHRQQRRQCAGERDQRRVDLQLRGRRARSGPPPRPGRYSASGPRPSGGAGYSRRLSRTGVSLQDDPGRGPRPTPIHLHPRQLGLRRLRLDRRRRLLAAGRSAARERDHRPRPGARRQPDRHDVSADVRTLRPDRRGRGAAARVDPAGGDEPRRRSTRSVPRPPCISSGEHRTIRRSPPRASCAARPPAWATSTPG